MLVIFMIFWGKSVVLYFQDLRSKKWPVFSWFKEEKVPCIFMTYWGKGDLYFHDLRSKKCPVFSWFKVEKVPCIFMTYRGKGNLYFHDLRRKKCPVFSWFKEEKLPCIFMTYWGKGDLYFHDLRRKKCPVFLQIDCPSYSCFSSVSALLEISLNSVNCASRRFKHNDFKNCIVLKFFFFG